MNTETTTPTAAVEALPPIQPPAKAGTRSLVREMAERFGMEPGPFQQALMATVMPKGSSLETLAAFLVVAREHDLNPFLREIFAFESNGGIRPMVPIDGWAKIVNRQEAYDGCELVEIFDEQGKFIAVECRMHRKDRAHPLVLREYLDECQNKKETWSRWPKRMLRHKAFMQAARIAFGLSGIEDEDEYERTASVLRPRRTVEHATIDIEEARAAEPRDPPGGSTLTQPPTPVAAQEPVTPQPAAQEAEPQEPAVRELYGLTIEVTEPQEKWPTKLAVAPKTAFHGMLLSSIREANDKWVNPALKKLVAAGLEVQAEQGIAPRDPFQYAALLLELREKG